jgi:hypothetical protein
LALASLALDGGDLFLESDHGRVRVRVAGPGRGQVLLEPGQVERGRFGAGRGARDAQRLLPEGLGVGELGNQGLASLRRANLVVAVEA